MRVSVILPVRDGAEFVAQAIASVLAQEGAAVELVAVDDGSTDGSAEVVRAACPPAVLLSTPGVGPAAARNAGVAAATGEVIGFIDHDDLWPPGKLARQLDALADPAVDVVAGETLVAWLRSPGVDLVHVLRDAERKPLANVGAHLFRRGALDRLGGFDATLRFGEDVDLLLRAAESGLVVRRLPEVGLIYRIHGCNMTCGLRGADLGIPGILRRRLSRRDREARPAAAT